MTYLLDTQAFLWFESGNDALSSKARDIIESPLNTKLISVASFWEMAIKISLGKLTVSKSLEELTALSGYNHLAITISHIRQVSLLPFHHGNPFDRLLIAQPL